MRPWGNFDELHHTTLGDLLAERGLDLPAEDRQRLVRRWHRLDPWPDVRGGLDRLRRGWVTATLSNGHVALLVDLARHGGLSFDCVLSTELAHLYKPVPEAYLLAPRLLDLEPVEVMMVAAHPWDLAGAREAGLSTAFVDRSLEYGSGSPAREDPQADISVSGLDELADRLGA